VRPQYETDREASADFAASFADLYGSSRRPVVAAGISLSVPVFDGGASHLRREQRLLQEEAAARAVAQTAAELYRLRGDVAADRDAAFRRFERASEQIRGAQARVSRAVALLNVGDATEDDVQRAQLDLERRRVELRRGAADYTTAMLRYRSLQGQRVLSDFPFYRTLYPPGRSRRQSSRFHRSVRYRIVPSSRGQTGLGHLVHREKSTRTVGLRLTRVRERRVGSARC
jgi:hypothetical protein